MSLFKKTRLDRNVFADNTSSTPESEVVYPRIREEEEITSQTSIISAETFIPIESSPVALQSNRNSSPKTVNPYTKPTPKPQKTRIKLTPISKDDEALFDTLVSEEYALILNRANIDTDNPTISAKGHALIEVKNGEVYISNQTTAQTTFVQVKSPALLKSGDVILLGNRLVQIEIENIAQTVSGLDD
jgi:hypothetical protein